MHDEITPLAYTEDQLVQLFPISKRQLFELRRRGQVPHMKVGKRVLYPTREISEWIEAQVRGRID